MSPWIHVHADAPSLTQALATSLETRAKEAVEERGVFRMALSGGSSPRDLYRALGGLGDFPWKQSRFFQVDERYVAPGHQDHNGTMILDCFARPDFLFFPMDTDLASSAEGVARQYARVLEREFDQGPLVFDLILLGMGTDGHTASLFPHSGALERHDEAVLAVDPPAAPHRRISLGLGVLRAARSLVLLPGGTDKGPMLRQVLQGPQDQLAASLVLPPQAPGEVWISADLARAAGLMGS